MSIISPFSAGIFSMRGRYGIISSKDQRIVRKYLLWHFLMTLRFLWLRQHSSESKTSCSTRMKNKPTYLDLLKCHSSKLRPRKSAITHQNPCLASIRVSSRRQSASNGQRPRKAFGARCPAKRSLHTTRCVNIVGDTSLHTFCTHPVPCLIHKRERKPAPRYLQRGARI